MKHIYKGLVFCAALAFANTPAAAQETLADLVDAPNPKMLAQPLIRRSMRDAKPVMGLPIKG